MKIEETKVTIGDLVDGYRDNGEGGVIGYGGNLDIRPRYQREFVYKDKQRNAVIQSVLSGFPLNVMYWAVRRGDGTYEVLDGQQRTLSICQYVNGDFSIDDLYFNNQRDDIQRRIKGYELTVYQCDGEDSEKLNWFKIVNIAGERLTEQELRNAVYAGSWVAAAKRHFSRRNCAAENLSKSYVKADPVRQELLEIAIKWISGGKIKDYMASHQEDDNADELWNYFQKVIQWIEATFTNKQDIMKKVNWGEVYAAHGDTEYDPETLDAKIQYLLNLPTHNGEGMIQKKSGIYRYVLDGDEQHLHLRTFKREQKEKAYERQKGECAACRKVFDFKEMHGDHIKPWKEGGLSHEDNLQMLCRTCNLRKGAE